jgi:hypothetical protein
VTRDLHACQQVAAGVADAGAPQRSVCFTDSLFDLRPLPQLLVEIICGVPLLGFATPANQDTLQRVTAVGFGL